jgi:hypothetical protein
MCHDHLMYDTRLTFNEKAAVCLQYMNMISQFNLDPAFERGRALSIEECFLLADWVHQSLLQR